MEYTETMEQRGESITDSNWMVTFHIEKYHQLINTLQKELEVLSDKTQKVRVVLPKQDNWTPQNGEALSNIAAYINEWNMQLSEAIERLKVINSEINI